MRSRRTRTVLATAGAAIVLTALVPVGARAQTAPTFTATPSPVALGQVITLVLDGCSATSAGVAVFESFQDTAGGLALHQTTPGRWEGTIPIRSRSSTDDLTFYPSCGGQSFEALAVTVDVDNPKLLPMPWHPPGSFPDPPTSFLGTDCPPGTTARAFFQADGRPAPVLRTAAINGKGDWTVDVPDFPDGTLVEVSASCGSVSYRSTTYVAGGTDSTTTTSSTTTTVGSTSTTTVASTTPTPPGTALAPAAVPVPGAATLTG